MNRNTILGVVVGSGLVSLAAFAQRVSAPVPIGPAPPVVGRWQIINPVPSAARFTMLLDTATGNTWVACADGANEQRWCAVERTNSPSGGVGTP
jgi:hypothetical protein